VKGLNAQVSTPSVDSSLGTRLSAVLSVAAGSVDAIGFLAVGLLLAGFLAVCVAAGSRIEPNAASALLAGMLGVSAMAVQNALLQISLTERLPRPR
jgi:uncharacterized membrane protein YoaK (UPF0700 family)